ncbi:MAG: TetR family transcriptional regulator [Muricauda sp.]|nr:TetR/AcrR family transcriptional regulator [uncultured Allomuricauda sp.]MBC73405.1 TetR family transcriptional regulator [Allomuricauda sp.]|tara:strand:- start:37031 stop:37621 length:591 start_codon:yes stop_codon:yes gene_type:complete
MIGKKEILRCSVESFTKYGSKHFTMDEIAQTLGISKKTIYKYFKGKEDLVMASVKVLTDEFAFEVEQITKENQDPITSIVLIYENGFERLKKFRPSFIFGIKKYYPSAYEVFQGFRSHIIKTVIYDLLEKAKKNGFILHEVKLDLFCDLYFNKFEEILFKDNYFIERYLDTDVFKHLIIYNLRGITVSGYDNKLLG